MPVSEVGIDCGHAIGCDCRECIERCLVCPLEVCRHDYPGGIASVRVDQRREIILRLRGEGKATEEIAEILEISKRTVFRTLHA